jgi:hypothetical protein
MPRANVELSKWRAYAALDAAEKSSDRVDAAEATLDNTDFVASADAMHRQAVTTFQNAAAAMLRNIELAEADGVPVGETSDLRTKHDAAQAKADAILQSL